MLYFVSGKALEPLKKLAQQAERIDQDSLVEVRLEENTIPEFRDLSQSVNRMLDRLAHSFDLQRQFAGNAAHELKTPLAIMQAKLEMFAEEHPDADSEITDLLRFQTDQVSRLASLVRTLLEMSDLQSIPREDHIELAPLADEIVADLTPLAQRRSITLFQECEDVSIKGSDTLNYRHPHHRDRKVRPRQGRQLERFKYRQRWFRRKLGREILHSTAFAVTFYFSLG